MFSNAYFPANYFAPTYFPPGVEGVAGTTVFCVARTDSYVAGAVAGEGYEQGAATGEGC